MLLVLASLFVLQQPVPAQVRRPATATMEVRVTDRTGTPGAAAQITAEGPSSRSGVTDADGLATLRTLSPGTYRVRAEREGFIALEKEVTIRAGASTTVELALSAAPPPPMPEPRPPAPVTPASMPVSPGAARVLSVPDLAERSLGGRDPVKTQPIGCSGLSRAELLLVRDSRASAANSEVDEMLYVVAGEASLTLAEKEQTLAPGWFALVPRGTSSTIARKGRNPVIVISIVSGEPCGAAARTVQP